MDIARLGGIVFPDSFGADLLDASEIDKFAKTKVYLKGIAEDKPIPIYYSKAITKIAAIHKAPLNKIIWKVIKKEEKLSEFRKLGLFYHNLSERPTDPDEILVKATYPSVSSGKKLKNIIAILKPEFKYETAGDEYYVIIDMADIANMANSHGVKEGWKISLEIKYPVRAK
jgi:hypothetical protein